MLLIGVVAMASRVTVKVTVISGRAKIYNKYTTQLKRPLPPSFVSRSTIFLGRSFVIFFDLVMMI